MVDLGAMQVFVDHQFFLLMFSVILMLVFPVVLLSLCLMLMSSLSASHSIRSTLLILSCRQVVEMHPCYEDCWFVDVAVFDNFAVRFPNVLPLGFVDVDVLAVVGNLRPFGA